MNDSSLKKSSNKSAFDKLCVIVFVLYCILLFWVVILKCNQMQSLFINYDYASKRTLQERFELYLVPFNSYFMNGFDRSALLKDDLLNVVTFIPMGLYITHFSGKKSIFRVMFITFCVSAFIEAFQLFSLIGTFGSKDLITNTFGAALGFGIYKFIYTEKRTRFLSICSCVIILIALPITIYAIINSFQNLNGYLDLIFRRV